jgi:hypothetical protein
MDHRAHLRTFDTHIDIYSFDMNVIYHYHNMTYDKYMSPLVLKAFMLHHQLGIEAKEIIISMQLLFTFLAQKKSKWDLVLRNLYTYRVLIFFFSSFFLQP